MESTLTSYRSLVRSFCFRVVSHWAALADRRGGKACGDGCWEETRGSTSPPCLFLRSPHCLLCGYS